MQSDAQKEQAIAEYQARQAATVMAAIRKVTGLKPLTPRGQLRTTTILAEGYKMPAQSRRERKDTDGVRRSVIDVSRKTYREVAVAGRRTKG